MCFERPANTRPKFWSKRLCMQRFIPWFSAGVFIHPFGKDPLRVLWLSECISISSRSLGTRVLAGLLSAIAMRDDDCIGGLGVGGRKRMLHRSPEDGAVEWKSGEWLLLRMASLDGVGG